jgi:hypothetical protein
MKTLLYLFLFLVCLFGVTYSIVLIGEFGEHPHFSFQLISLFLTMGGAILFGYVFAFHIKEI